MISKFDLAMQVDMQQTMHQLQPKPTTICMWSSPIRNSTDVILLGNQLSQDESANFTSGTCSVVSTLT